MNIDAELKSSHEIKPIPLRVSIGMPVYNGEKYIQSSIDSLLKQSLYDFELIIADNASTDNTGFICEVNRIKDNRIKYFRHKSNIGAHANFQFVLEIAKAQYFMWAASDDLWDNDWLETCYNKIKIQQMEALVFGRLQFINARGEKICHAGNRISYRLASKFSLLRSCAYYLIPESFAKANIIYSLFPTQKLKCAFSAFKVKDYPFADVILVYTLISQLRLHQNYTSTFYKRLHNANIGGSLFPDMALGYRLCRLITLIFFQNPAEMIKNSKGFCTKLALVFLWPFKVVMGLYGIFYSRQIIKFNKNPNKF